MKALLTTTLALAAIASATFAEDSHDKAIDGPKGGRIVELPDGHAEFLVQPDKKVSVTFYGEDMKPVVPAGQGVTVIAEAPQGKARLAFEKTSDAFVSTTPLPEGDAYRVVLQIKATADAKPENFRIDYLTEICTGCKRPEYACTCTAGEAHEGHGH